MASSKPILPALFLSSLHAEEGQWNQPVGVASFCGAIWPWRGMRRLRMLCAKAWKGRGGGDSLPLRNSGQKGEDPDGSGEGGLGRLERGEG
jgi:hypothetical protein